MILALLNLQRLKNEGINMIEQFNETEWSISDGDYIRKKEYHDLDFNELRRRDKVKRRIITGIVLILAFGLELFFIEIIAKL